jgi:hypothetical protein
MASGTIGIEDDAVALADAEIGHDGGERFDSASICA